MGVWEKIFGYTPSRIWFIVTAVVLVLAIAVNLLATTVFYNVIGIVLGREQAIYEEGVEIQYQKATGSKEEAWQQANDLNERAVEEGIVLLRNAGGALPTATPETAAAPAAERPRVSVFGKNSVNLVYSGSGSAGNSHAGAKDIYDSLEAAGYDCNPVLRAFYEDVSKSGPARESNPSDLDSGGTATLKTAETPYASYIANDIPASYDGYQDMAVIVLSRIGGEGFDLSRTSADDFERHYLELDPNEVELITQVCAYGFGRVVLVLNSSNAMELGFLEDGTFGGKIDACLWIGGPGDSGIMALGRVLNGNVNPSGRTVDTYAADFTADPTWYNFGDSRSADGDVYTLDGKNRTNFFVDYEEGIYVGYRYWETRGYTDGEDWYQEHVVYPFGYGLSYTTFEWELAPTAPGTVSGTDRVELEVKVTNTGSMAGKDVVEVYVTAPYYEGGIEKAHNVLAGFAKTALLQPNESSTVKIEFAVEDLASYDYNDANENGFTGYELEAGDYVVKVAHNAHDASVEASFTFTVPDGGASSDGMTQAAEKGRNGFAFRRRESDEAEVVNRFDDADDELGSVLSRADWEGTWPAPRTDAERAADSEFLDSLADRATNNPESFTVVPTQGAAVDAEGEPVSLYSMVGRDFDDPDWEKLLDQLSASQMADLFNQGAFQTIALLNIDKPKTIDADGPVGFTSFMNDPSVYGTCSYCAGVVLASTWNVELLYEMGACVGEEGLWGNVAGDGTTYSGWYAPAMNIHRSPFGGRNCEYFSEDGFLSGMMASYEIQGAASKGVYTLIKHFALNEQETHRSVNGLVTWTTEQSMRELYLKPFELAVKLGNTHGIMSSFNRIGTKWTGGDYRLLTEVLRNEWGFEGMVICDFNTNSYMDCEQMIYAGGDLNLASTTNRMWDSYDAGDAGDVTMLRRAAKNILDTVANSNAMNGRVIGYRLPLWVTVMIAVDCLLAAGLALWGFFVVKKAQGVPGDGRAVRKKR